MFTEIPEPEFYKLRNHAKKLKNLIPTNVKKEVLEDYYFKMLSGDKYKDESVSDKMFAFLETLNEEQLFALLSRETPKIIALALEQLDNEKVILQYNQIKGFLLSNYSPGDIIALRPIWTCRLVFVTVPFFSGHAEAGKITSA